VISKRHVTIWRNLIARNTTTPTPLPYNRTMAKSKEKVTRWRFWQFSLRSLLLLILLVAMFCLGWICNERWRLSVPPSLSSAQAESNAYLLYALGEVNSQIQGMDNGRGQTKSARLDREARLDRAAKMRNAISKRVADQNAKMWGMIALFSISGCVIAFAVGRWHGRQPTNAPVP
jgi:uncharacterized membrane protein